MGARANEILKKTDLAYDWRSYKHVRKIIGVEFFDIHIKEKPIPEEVMAILPSQYQADKDVLANLRTWLEKKGIPYVTEKIHYTISRNPAKFGDYLYRALEGDFGHGFNPAQAAATPDFEKKKAGEKVAAEAAAKEKVEEEFEAKRWVEAKARFDSLDLGQKEKIMGEFENTKVLSFLGVKMARQDYGYVSPAAQVLFKGFLKTKLLGDK